MPFWKRKSRLEEWNPDTLLKRHSIRIPNNELNPVLQMIIGTDVPFLKEPITIRNSRILREIQEVNILSYAALAYGSNSFSLADKPHNFFVTPLVLATGGVAYTYLAKRVQKLHEELADEMNRVGVLQSKFEGRYPRDWMNPSIISRTHPVFYVNRKGDLVFVKESRAEYYRYRFQRAFPGKLGLNFWRWRAYLRPPKVPEAWKVWAARKIKEHARRWKPVKAGRPVPVPLGAPAGRYSFRFRAFRPRQRGH